MRHTKGWFKIHRSIFESDIAQNNNRLILFLRILANANIESSKIEWQGKPKTIKRGDMLTGNADLSVMCKMSIATVRRQLEYLVDSRAIDMQTSTKGTIITVRNYERYQDKNKVVGKSRSTDEQTNDKTDDTTNDKTNDQTNDQTDEQLNEELRSKKEEVRTTISHSANEDENSLKLVSPEIMPQEPKKKASKKKAKTKAVSKTVTKSDGTFVWEAYSSAYANQYGHLPIRNAKVNALCSQLVKRIGKSAPEVAAFYVSHRASWYVQKLHMLEYCVKDAEKLYTELQAGMQMTNKQANQCDFAQSLDQAGDAYMKNLDKLGLDL